MTAFAIVNGRKYMMRTRCTTEDGAFRRLLKGMADELGCFEVSHMWCEREPRMVTAEVLMGCRELI